MNDDKLFSWLASVKGDPLAFVMGAFPWNEPGTVLAESSGPEQWAADTLTPPKKRQGSYITKS